MAHRLRRQLGVDAVRPRGHQAPHAGQAGTVDRDRLERSVVADELRRVGVVGHDAADLGHRQEHHFGLFIGQKRQCGPFVGEVEFGMGAYERLFMPCGAQFALKSRADQSTVAGDVYRGS